MARSSVKYSVFRALQYIGLCLLFVNVSITSFKISPQPSQNSLSRHLSSFIMPAKDYEANTLCESLTISKNFWFPFLRRKVKLLSVSFDCLLGCGGGSALDCCLGSFLGLRVKLMFEWDGRWWACRDPGNTISYSAATTLWMQGLGYISFLASRREKKSLALCSMRKCKFYSMKV